MWGAQGFLLEVCVHTSVFAGPSTCPPLSAFIPASVVTQVLAPRPLAPSPGPTPSSESPDHRPRGDAALAGAVAPGGASRGALSGS